MDIFLLNKNYFSVCLWISLIVNNNIEKTADEKSIFGILGISVKSIAYIPAYVSESSEYQKIKKYIEFIKVYWIYFISVVIAMCWVFCTNDLKDLTLYRIEVHSDYLK